MSREKSFKKHASSKNDNILIQKVWQMKLSTYSQRVEEEKKELDESL